jgi:hypothetical protein
LKAYFNGLGFFGAATIEGDRAKLLRECSCSSVSWKVC